MIYRRGFLRESTAYGAAALAVLAGVMLLILLSRLLKEAASGALPPTALGGMLVFALLKYAPQVLTMAVFCGALLSLSRAFRDREMIGWFCAGIGLRAFIAPVLLFALPAALLIGWLSLIGSPWSIRAAEEFRDAARAEARLENTAPGAFGEVRGTGLTYIFERREDGAQIADIFAAGGGEQSGAFDVVLAKRGSRAGANAVVLEGGRQYRIPPAPGLPVDTLDFSSYKLFLDGGDNGDSTAVRLRALPLTLLARDDGRRARAELIWRLNLPLAALVLALLALPLSRAHPRTGKSYGLLLAIVAFWIYQSALGLFKSWVGGGEIGAFGGLILPHLAVAGAVLLIMSPAIARGLPPLPFGLRRRR